MKKLDKPEVLKKYIKQYALQRIVSSDLVQLSCLLEYPKHELLISQGKQTTYLLFLLEGEIKIYTHLNSGYVQNFRYYRANAQLLGEASGLWQMKPSANIYALSPCLCLGIFMPQHRETLLNDNRFLRYVAQQMCERQQNKNFLTEPLEIRFASFIQSVAANDMFVFNLTECATILNTSSRHLFRTINSMCTAGILQKVSGGYLILRPDLLEAMTRGEVI